MGAKESTDLGLAYLCICELTGVSWSRLASAGMALLHVSLILLEQVASLNM